MKTRPQKNVLAIGAHYDDLELGCAGTLMRHVEHGDKVVMLVLTHSAYTYHQDRCERSAETAAAEGRAGAGLIGADLLSAGLETKQLVYCANLIEIIDKVVQERQIDTIYTHWCHDVHQDHSATGRASLNAGRRVNNLYMYRSNWYQTTETFREDYFIDISSYMDRKVAAIRAHASEVAVRTEAWIEFFRGENSRSGARCGVEYAESFQTVKHMWEMEK